MKPEQKVGVWFTEAAELIAGLASIGIVENTVKAAAMIVDSLKQGGKVVVFGNGGSAADAQHMAAEFTGRFLRNRAAYAAIALTTDTSALTAIANDYGYDRIFARQVEALVKENDVVIGISTSGSSPNVVKGLISANHLGAKTIALLGDAKKVVGDAADLCLTVPSDYTPRIQEAHAVILHVICQLVEEELSPEHEMSLLSGGNK